MKVNSLLLAIGSAALLASGAVSADPVLRLTASGGVPAVTIVDEGAGDAAPGNPGNVGFVGALGGWVVNDTSGVGSPAPGSPNLALTSINISTFGVDPFPAGGGSLTIEFSEQNLTLGALPQLVNFLAGIDGSVASGGTIDWELWISDANGLFDLSQLIDKGSATGGNSGPSGFSGAFGGLRSVADTFSMTLRVTITHADGQHTTNFDFDASSPDRARVAQVPEPATLLLLGFALVLVAFVPRRRRA